MRHASSLAGSIACLALLAKTVAAGCIAFGMDFQENGTYFQNSQSTDPFTFVTEFEGCNNDIAYNALVDPQGTEYFCSDTNLQPSDTDQLSTCPIDKNQLSSGAWSIIIFSNNDGDSIAYEVDFSLSVGPQSTSTYTPTVTVTSTTTPVVTTTDYTTTDTVCVTGPTETVTVPRVTVQKTRTHTPHRVTTTTTVTLPTITETEVKLSITKATVTVMASCKLPTRPAQPNPTCTKLPKIFGGLVKNPPHRMARGIDNFDRDTFLEERRDRIAANSELQKRAPDPQPLVVTDTNTADYQTATVTITDPTYVTVYGSTTTTQTITPMVTVVKGRTTLPPIVVTAPTPTKTKTKFTIPTTTTTVRITKTVTITTTTRPAASKTACRKAGGIYY